MDFSFQDFIPHDFGENSHVWVYQSNRAFTFDEEVQIKGFIQNFAKDWNPAGTPIKMYSTLLFRHFIILIIDETTTAIGNTTDNYLSLIKSIEKIFNVELFDRLMLAFIIREQIEVLPLSQLNPSIEKFYVTPDTRYFNNMVLTKKDLFNNWIIPAKESWFATRF